MRPAAPALALLLALGAGAARAALQEPARAAEQLLKLYGPVLAQGLERSQNAAGCDEYLTLLAVSRLPGVSALLLNRYGEVRFAEDPRAITMKFELFKQDYSPDAAGIEEAFLRKKPVARLEPEGYTITLPMRRGGYLLGLLQLRADGPGLDALLTRHQKLVSRRVRYDRKKDPPRSREAEQHYLSALIFHLDGRAAGAREEFALARKLSPGDPDIEGASRWIDSEAAAP